ncbi:MAG: hypothetical protein IJZ35_03655 [Clostridia bacterium]|nr:hypothetical protein [Clostridia bacterium]
MYKKIIALFLLVSIVFTFSSCADKDTYYTADDGTQYLVCRDAEDNLVINDSGKLLVYTLNENNKKIKSDSGEYITEYVDFNGQVVYDGTVETAEMRFELPNGFVESRENPGYFFNSAYQGEIFIDYYASGMDIHIQAQETNCEDLLESFGSEVFSYKKYTVDISGIECTAFNSLSTTSEYYRNAFFYFIPYDTGYYIINCNISTDYKNKVDFDSFVEDILIK